MGWVRISDDFYDHPKFAEAGPLGIALWLAGIAWSNRNLTDGLIPASRARVLLDWDGVAWGMWSNGLFGGGDDCDAEQVAKHLVAIGLWHEVPSGYQIHDYLEYQPSADQIREKRRKERERWQRRADSTSNSGVDSTADSAPTPRVSQPQTQHLSTTDGEAAPKRRRKTACPEKFSPRPEDIEWVERTWPHVDWDRESQKFVNSAKAHGRVYADWFRAWRSWMDAAGEGRFK